MPVYPPPIPNPLVPTVPVEPVRTLRSVLDEVDAAVAGALAAREAVEKALAAVGDVASAAESAKSAASSASAAESAKSAASASASSSASSASSAAESARSAGESASSASASAKSASAVLASADGAASKSLEYAASAAASAELALQRAQSVGDSASVAETRAESAKEYAESARKSAESAEGSVASAAKAGADAAASLLDAKLDKTYADNGYVEEHAAGKVTMTSNETAAVTLDASDGGSVTVGSSKLMAPSGKLLSNGSEVALADAVRGKADLAVYDVKGFRLDGMKMVIRVSNSSESWEANVGTVVTEDEKGVEVEVGELSVAGGTATCQMGSVPLPGDNPELTSAVLEVSGVLTAGDGGAYVPVGASARFTLSGTADYGDGYGEYNFEFYSHVAADGSLSPDTSDFYSSYGPRGLLCLYGSVDADPYVEKSTDTLAKSSEKLDASPHNTELRFTRDDTTEQVLELYHEKSCESVRLSAPSTVGGANIQIGGGMTMASVSLYHTTGLDVRDDEYNESTYGISASVAKDLKVLGDVRVPSLLLFCEGDNKYHRLKAEKTTDGTFALALDQEGVN